MPETLNAEQFRNQFPVKVELCEASILIMELEGVAFGRYPVYRVLNRLFILDADGSYYGTH